MSTKNHIISQTRFLWVISTVLGLLIAVILLGGIANANNEPTKFSSTTADIIFVDSDSTGGSTGEDWANAYNSLQDALAVATRGNQIWVAEGVYYPDEGTGQIDNEPTSTFQLIAGVAMYGGFDPDSEVDTFLERDWETYITVLSGDLQQDDLTDSHNVVTITMNISGTNAFHVVYGNSVTETAVMDGFWVTAGKTDQLMSWDDAGGGMLNERSSPTLANMVFSGNLAEAGGGGMLNREDVYFIGEGSNPSLTNIIFHGNSANTGGGMANGKTSNPTLSNIVFQGNKADWGGGMYNSENNLSVITNAIFSGNQATWYGGGLFNFKGSPVLVNTTFSGNSTGIYGGGIYNSHPDSIPMITNCIFWNNQDNSGTGTIESSIYNDDGSTPIISFSNVQGCGGSDNWQIVCGTDGGNNIDIDPLFVIPANPVDPDTPPIMAGDLHLQSSSPAIDAGDNNVCPAIDLDGLPRPIGTYCDLGAYENPKYIHLPLVFCPPKDDLPLGALCSQNDECQSGNCIDDVCCESSCTEICRACTAAKTGGVDGVCDFILYGTDPDDECMDPYFCDGAGVCTLEELPNGAPCSQNSECQSGNCVDNVCCDTNCSEICKACTAAKTGGFDGVCAFIPFGTDPDDECPDPSFCNGTGVCILEDLPIGASCSQSSECQSGNCVDDVCCDTSCSGVCEACVASKTGGVDGICTLIPFGTDPDDECPDPSFCDGTGACSTP